MKTRMGWSASLSIAACFSLVPPAWAGALTPSKASQVVTIRCDGSGVYAPGCSISPSSGFTINPDGSASSGFTIPSGQVLVITSASSEILTGTNGGPASGALAVGSNVVWNFAGPSYLYGALSSDKVFVPGIVVKPGTTISGGASGAAVNFYLAVNGFLAADK
jgi:hypothetical protein